MKDFHILYAAFIFKNPKIFLKNLYISYSNHAISSRNSIEHICSIQLVTIFWKVTEIFWINIFCLNFINKLFINYLGNCFIHFLSSTHCEFIFCCLHELQIIFIVTISNKAISFYWFCTSAFNMRLISLGHSLVLSQTNK